MQKTPTKHRKHKTNKQKPNQTKTATTTIKKAGKKKPEKMGLVSLESSEMIESLTYFLGCAKGW